MTATLCLLGCLLAPAQTPDRPAPAVRGEWAVAPHLGKAQELVYRGSFTEEADGAGVQFNRAFRIESRVFVLETPPKGADVAFLTILKSRETPEQRRRPAANRRPSRCGSSWPTSIRRAASRPSPASSLAVPLEGPPTLECGAFAVVPDGRVAADSTWETAEEGRPMRSWRVVGAEQIDGERCVKLEGVQKSDDWDKPRGDRAAWRRTDTVWLAPRTRRRLPRGARRRTPRAGPPRTDLQGRAALQPGRVDAVPRPALRRTSPRDHAGPRLRRRRRPAADDAGQVRRRSSPPS